MQLTITIFLYSSDRVLLTARGQLSLRSGPHPSLCTLPFTHSWAPGVGSRARPGSVPIQAIPFLLHHGHDSAPTGCLLGSRLCMHHPSCPCTGPDVPTRGGSSVPHKADSERCIVRLLTCPGCAQPQATGKSQASATSVATGQEAVPHGG